MNRDGRNLEDFLAAGKACKLYSELSCTGGGGGGGRGGDLFRCGFSADGMLSK